MTLIEADIQRHFRREVIGAGGRPEKFDQRRGRPDFVVFWSDSVVDLVELKKPGEKMKKIQAAWAARLYSLGHTVILIDSKAGVNRYVARRVELEKARAVK